jgi:hypothetical protein
MGATLGSRSGEEDVIRERFPVHMTLSAQQLTTVREPADIAPGIMTVASTFG